MTISKKDLEAQQASNNDEIRLQIGKSTWTFRWTMLIGVFLATPFGANLLKNLGVTSPAVVQTSELQNDVKQMKESLADMGKDVTSLKATNAIVTSKVDEIQRTFTGFQVDFDKYKAKQEPK